VAYAIMAGTVPDGSITAGKIAAGAVGTSQLAPNITIPGTLTVSNLVINGSAVTGSTNYLIPSGTNIQTQAGGTYFITNTSASFILPTIANVGDTIRIITPIQNGQIYNILQNPGQRIVAWNRNAISGINYPVVCSADGSHLIVNANYGRNFFLSTNSGGSWSLQPIIEPWPSPNGVLAFQISGDGSCIFASVVFQNFSGLLIYTLPQMLEIRGRNALVFHSFQFKIWALFQALVHQAEPRSIT
jgi:hypothetical protein